MCEKDSCLISDFLSLSARVCLLCLTDVCDRGTDCFTRTLTAHTMAVDDPPRDVLMGAIMACRFSTGGRTQVCDTFKTKCFICKLQVSILALYCLVHVIYLCTTS